MKKIENNEIMKTENMEVRTMMFINNIRVAFLESLGFAPKKDKIELVFARISTDEIYVKFIVFSMNGSFGYILNNGEIESEGKIMINEEIRRSDEL